LSGTTIDPDDGSTAAPPGSTSSESGGSSSTTGAPDQACGLEDLKPGTPDPIQSGAAAMHLPPDIAQILLISCGCHLADDHTVEDVPDYPSTGGFDMTMWAGWHADHPTTRMPYHALALTYVESEFMPLESFCNVDGEAMDPSHRATLLDWLGQGAPDGATWMP
jgi:hypothetical protein